MDLFSRGALGNLVQVHHLVVAKVEAQDSLEEVRLKIHPNSKLIHWIECTCPKNRMKSLYCEHLVAFILSLDQRKPELIKIIQNSKGFLPPPSQKRYTKEPSESREPQGLGSMTERLLDRLKNTVDQVRIEPTGQILLEVQSQTAFPVEYSLNLDEAVSFFRLRPDLLNGLELKEGPFYLGFYIEQDQKERLIRERILVTPEKDGDEHKKQKKFIENGRRLLGEEEETKNWKYWSLAGTEDPKVSLGKEYGFIPGFGYFPLNQKGLDRGWLMAEPQKKVLSDQEACELLDQEFLPYREKCNLWLSASMKGLGIQKMSQSTQILLERDEAGWFYLDPQYDWDNNQLSMVDLLLSFKDKKQKYVKHKGQWFQIPEFFQNQSWEVDQEKKRIKLDPLGLIRFQASTGEFDRFVGSDKALGFLQGTKDHPLPPLDHTKLTLRPYQVEGLEWFWWLYKNNLHGLLADDMGLGKTHQAMAVLSAIQKENPESKFLVICPTTVIDHWQQKILEFAPNLAPKAYYGHKRTAHIKESEWTVLLTTYGVLLRDLPLLQKIPWQTVILDEAHFIKNHKTATYQAVCQIKSTMRICLTGTPLENHLGELKTIFDFLVPGYLGSSAYFKKHFQHPIESAPKGKEEILLQKLIHPLKLRRSKKEVLSDLPEKVEDIRYCFLSDEQKALYHKIIAMRARPLLHQIEQNDREPVPYLHVFSILQLLKQICDHPHLVSPQNANMTSGKFELLKELLQEALDSHNKVVIFTQYLGMTRIIKSYCDENNIGSVVLTGQTQKRGEVIASFQEDPGKKVFIGSLLAGGIGIDLTAASVVIHYDRWWNASKENQATDRVHRIGQKNFVQVFKLVTRGTLEEKIDLMIQKKQGLFDKFIEKDEDLFKTLSRQDVISLLQFDP